MSDEGADPETDSARFGIDLFIIHPTREPAEISAALGMVPTHAHRVDDRFVTPRGTVLSHVNLDTRWRHARTYETQDKRFAAIIVQLVDELVPRKDGLLELRRSGGETRVRIRFLGDGYLGDTIPRALLAKLVELEVDFDIECYAVPQSV